jgi:hypothetical protein
VRAAIVALAIGALCVQAVALPAASYAARPRPRGSRPSSSSSSSSSSPHAPSAAPLLDGPSSLEVAPGSDASASAPPSGGDPLVENGLGSPLCGRPAELAASARRNCETSGFEAAGAPTGDYALDVHIDAGLLGLTSQTLLQDYLIVPVWTALVWVVHALVVISIKVDL